MGQLIKFNEENAIAGSNGGFVSVSKEWGGGDGWALCDFKQAPGVLTMQVLSPATDDNGAERWVDTDVSFTAESTGGIKHFKLPPGLALRVRVSGIKAHSRVSCTIHTDPRRKAYAS